MPDGENRKAERTRRGILLKAVDLASVEGLGGLSIGRLADALSMSKSGLFAHFGSKEVLQLAIVEAAREVFVRTVLAATDGVEAGLPRLCRLSSAWLAYVEDGLFRGGCFFAAVASEMDDRPGRVRDRIVELTRDWIEALEKEAAAALLAGQLGEGSDPAQIAFEIHAFLQEANWAFQLHGNASAFRLAARAIRRRIESEATPAGLALAAVEFASFGDVP
jgi:AcrR family transcriptional regulator